MLLTPNDGKTCCSHLDARNIQKAATAVRHACLSRSTHDIVCAECGLSGFFNDAKFRLHFLIEQHYVYVRVKEPLELYCCHCGDFQYSDSFDLLIGRKRFRKRHSVLESKRLKKTLIDRPQPRAIVNLGATCFMGSVLQVMLNNSVIIFSKQMQLNKNGLEPCSKGKYVVQKGSKDSSNSNSEGSNEVIAKEGSIAESALVTSCSSSTFSSSSSFTSSFPSSPTPSSCSSSSSLLISSGCIACEFKSLFWESAGAKKVSSTSPKGKASSAGLPCIIPSNLLYSVWSHADYMAGYDQQDAHEFLIALLDGLGSHLEKYHGEANTSYPPYPSPKCDQTVNANTSSNLNHSLSVCRSDSTSEFPLTDIPHPHSQPRTCPFPPHDIAVPPPMFPSALQRDSPRFQSSSSHAQNQGPWSPRITPNKSTCFKGFVNEVFAGWMQSELHCMHCGHCSYKLEPFLDISLSLEISSITLPNLRSDPDPDPDLLLPLLSENISTISNKTKDEIFSAGCTGSDVTSDHDDLTGDVEIDVEMEIDSSTLQDGFLPHTSLKEDSSNHNSNKSVKSCNARDESVISLSQCLQHFTSLEILSEQVHCDSCKQQRPSKKGLSISASPKVLVLHFKRFDSLRQLKICSKVGFPLRGFDLAPFMQQQQQQPNDYGTNSCSSTSSSKSYDNSNRASTYADRGSSQTELTPVLYDLQGLVNHKGSLTQGHYVAYVVAVKDEGLSTETTSWMRCDDESVTTVSEEDVLNAEGYILFYVSRNNVYGQRNSS